MNHELEAEPALREFLRAATETQSEIPPEVALFKAVRNLKYATDGAHEVEGLLSVRKGDCLAKSDLLRRGFSLLRLQSRLVRWQYELLSEPPEVNLLPSPLDLHRGVQVWIHNQWVLVDATHDPPLAELGLVVNEWDGRSPTRPAYIPTGPILVEGVDDKEIQEELSELKSLYEGSLPEDLEDYRRAFNEWLESARGES